MPKDPAELAALFVDAEPSSVDVIDAGGTIVLGSVYAGIDSVANQYANRSRFVPRRIVYELGALRAVIPWRPVSFEVTVDGERHMFCGYNVVAANSGYYGNGLHIAPDAAVDDGLLDIVAIEHMPKRRFATVMKEVENGTHVQRPEITVLRGREVQIRRRSGAARLWRWRVAGGPADLGVGPLPADSACCDLVPDRPPTRRRRNSTAWVPAERPTCRSDAKEARWPTSSSPTPARWTRTATDLGRVRDQRARDQAERPGQRRRRVERQP